MRHFCLSPPDLAQCRARRRCPFRSIRWKGVEFPKCVLAYVFSCPSEMQERRQMKDAITRVQEKP